MNDTSHRKFACSQRLNAKRERARCSARRFVAKVVQNSVITIHREKSWRLPSVRFTKYREVSNTATNYRDTGKSLCLNRQPDLPKIVSAIVAGGKRLTSWYILGIKYTRDISTGSLRHNERRHYRDGHKRLYSFPFIRLIILRWFDTRQGIISPPGGGVTVEGLAT